MHVKNITRKEIVIGNNIINGEGKPYVIAEIGNNHMGSITLAKEMVRLASLCGVNAVKLQKRDNKFLYTKDFYLTEYNSKNSFAKTYGEHRDFLELSKEDIIELIEYAHSYNVDIIITVFDEMSLKEMRPLNFDAYKIASGDITNTPLIEEVAKVGKPVILSTGYADFEDIDRAITAINEINDQLVVMYCVSQYPTEDDHLNLKMIKEYMERYNDVQIGFSSHENGGLGSVIAYVLGATVIERHFTISNFLKGTDQVFSLNIESMKKMISDLARANKMLGDGEKKQKENYEYNAAVKLRKGVYASRKINKGEIINRADLCIKSPQAEIDPYKIDEIIGMVAYKDINADEMISKKQVEYGRKEKKH